MGLGPIFKSIGKAVAEELPEGLKPQSVVPALKKGGVTDEELKFASVGKDVQTVPDSIKAFDESANAFDTEVIGGRTNTLYNWVNLSEQKNNPTYRERVITFGEEGRYTSPHFPEGASNYLMHNRSQDAFGPKGKERQLIEIQSDLHQAGRQHGYGNGLTTDDIKSAYALQKEVDSVYAKHNTDEAAVQAELQSSGLQSRIDAIETSTSMSFRDVASSTVATNAPVSPWEKTWLKKGIEIELADAIDKGVSVLSVPIKLSSKEELSRADGVQKWYESTVVDTMKKIAKQQGYQFEMDAAAQMPELISKSLVDDFTTTRAAHMKASMADTAEEYAAKKVAYDNAQSKILAEFFDTASLEAMNPGERFAAALSLTSKVDTDVLGTLADFALQMKPAKVKELAKKFNIDPNKDVSDIRDELTTLTDDLVEKGDTTLHARIIVPKTPLAQETVDAASNALKIPDLREFKSSQSEFLAKVNSAYMTGKQSELLKELGMTEKQLDTAMSKAEKAHVRERNEAVKQGTKQASELLGAEINTPYDIAKVAQNGTLKKPSFTLYSTPAAAVLAGLSMRQEGYSDEEIVAFAESKNVDADELKSQMDKAQTALDEGIPIEEIQAFLEKAPTTTKAVEAQHVSPAISPSEMSDMWSKANGGSAKDAAMLNVLSEDDNSDIKSLVASMQVVHPNMTSVTLRTAAFFGNEKAARIAEAALVSQATKIVNSAKEQFGIDMAWDPKESAFYLQGENGLTKIEPGITQLLGAESVEITAATIGAVLGAQQGKKFGNIGAAIGSVGGAIAGSILGTEADYLIEAMNMQVDMSYEVAAHKALTAAETSVIGDVVGFGLIKGAGTAWSGVKRAKDFIVDGNSEGAFKALKEVMFISDDEATDIVKRLESLTVEPIGGTDTIKAIAAIPTTVVGGDFLVKAAGHIDPMAGRAAVKAIDNRAKDLLKTADSLSDADAGKVLREDLTNYEIDVKNFYQGVKNEAASSPLAEEFTFNYNKLAISPILERLNKNITDPVVLQKFMLQAAKIRNMSESRNLTDLIELRHLVNGFKFNSRISNAKDFDALNAVLTKIDEGIETGARATMPDTADEWLVNYASARAKYAEMKSVQSNVMYKALLKPGSTEDNLAKKLTTYISSVDNTFSEVMSKLPEKTRHVAEGTVIRTLTDKFTAGVGEGIRAVHFPLLDEELKLVSFTSPEARQFKAAVGKLAAVFKNDVALANVSGQIQIPKFQSYLTADPVVRAKFEIASGIFNTIKTYVPGKTQRNMALVNNLAKVLETPLNSRSVRELMDEVAGEVDIEPQIVRLQQEAARRAMEERDKVTQMVKIYGEGAIKSMQGAGQFSEIPASRIATQATVRTVADADGIALSDTKALDFALKQRGYAGVMAGTTKVRVLK